QYTTHKRTGPGATPRARSRCDPSDLADVLRLQALGTLGDFEFDRVTLRKTPKAIGLDRREVDEHVRTRLLCDEAKALRVVEPLHLALCHTLLRTGAGIRNVPRRPGSGSAISWDAAALTSRGWAGRSSRSSRSAGW